MSRLSKTPSNYHFKVISVYHSSDEPLEENVFVCLTQKNKKLKEYYISEEYKLFNRKSLGPENHEYVVGRFIFHISPTAKQINLYGMAEVPAKTFFSPDYSVELIYLQRRKNYEICEFSSQFYIIGLISTTLTFV